MQNGAMMGSHMSTGPPPSHSGGSAPMDHLNGPLNSNSTGGSTEPPPISSSSTTTSSTHSPKTSSLGSSSTKLCGRPGCTNTVQRTPEGWSSEFCSNECVVGQCKEVYTSWSSTGSSVRPNGTGSAANGPASNPYTSPAPNPSAQVKWTLVNP